MMKSTAVAVSCILLLFKLVIPAAVAKQATNDRLRGGEKARHHHRRQLKGSKKDNTDATEESAVVAEDSCTYLAEYYTCDIDKVAICYVHDDHYHNKCVDIEHEDIWNKVPMQDMYKDKYTLLNCGCCPEEHVNNAHNNIFVTEIKYPKSYKDDPYCDSITAAPSTMPTIAPTAGPTESISAQPSSGPTVAPRVIEHKNSPGVLYGDPTDMSAGAILPTSAAFNADSTLWTIEDVPGSTGYFYIIHHESNGRLYSNDGQNVYLCNSCDGNSGAQWSFPSTNDGYHRIENRQHDRWLHVKISSGSFEMFTLGPKSWGGDNTRWRIV